MRSHCGMWLVACGVLMLTAALAFTGDGSRRLLCHAHLLGPGIITLLFYIRTRTWTWMRCVFEFQELSLSHCQLVSRPAPGVRRISLGRMDGWVCVFGSRDNCHMRLALCPLSCRPLSATWKPSESDLWADAKEIAFGPWACQKAIRILRV